MIFWESFFFLVVFVCGLFVQWNECSLLFPFKENTIYWVDVCFFLLIHANEISLSLYIDRFFSYFTNILWDKKVYSHAYLTICFIELACYGSRDNVLEQIIWIWNWRKFRLNLRYMILTSAALNPLSCCFFFSPLLYFHLLCFPHPVIMGCVCYLCVEVGNSLLDYFFLLRLLKSLFRLYSMLHEEKQVIGVRSASVGKCFFL